MIEDVALCLGSVPMRRKIGRDEWWTRWWTRWLLLWCGHGGAVISNQMISSRESGRTSLTSSCATLTRTLISVASHETLKDVGAYYGLPAPIVLQEFLPPGLRSLMSLSDPVPPPKSDGPVYTHHPMIDLLYSPAMSSRSSPERSERGVA